ncbi:hypothetical protein AAE02nite_27240 [Adhaeribacter aerolatus]|uniref:Lipocalin-like domain-containing protein n=1 Tax=Adhaeribacter aerolatus TaxID=670289 RepID=A0A512AZD3_9BACT|nr:hypothetical protein [Adhaeribacter aerolatus]GEO05060.1 hypothetical protein AAE02nite_27240 [Adhaeribacter aerolatus]
MNPRNQCWNLQHYTGFCLTALLLCLILTSARFDKTNFAGDWALSKEKSKLTAGQMRIIFSQLKVTQNGNDFTISRTGQTPDGQEFTMDEKITLDGKESENKFFDGMVKKKSTAKWSADEKALTITSALTFNRDGNEVTMNATEIWDTAKNPGELSINYTTTTPNGEIKDTYVYTKK